MVFLVVRRGSWGISYDDNRESLKLLRPLYYAANPWGDASVMTTMMMMIFTMQELVLVLVLVPVMVLVRAIGEGEGTS